MKCLLLGTMKCSTGDISLIEWADRVSGCLTVKYLKITLKLVFNKAIYIDFMGYGSTIRK